jgi:hypothetical protein
MELGEVTRLTADCSIHFVVPFIFVRIIYLFVLFIMLPDTVAALSGPWLCLSVTVIVGFNPAQDRDVFPRLSVLCRLLWVQALRRADHQSRDSYQMFK